MGARAQASAVSESEVLLEHTRGAVAIDVSSSHVSGLVVRKEADTEALARSKDLRACMRCGDADISCARESGRRWVGDQ